MDAYWKETAKNLILEEYEHDSIKELVQDEYYTYVFYFELQSGIEGVIDCWDREIHQTTY